MAPPKKVARKGPKAHEKCAVVKDGFRFVDTYKFEFAVGKQIGLGGFGRIYDGIQVATGKAVAIKMEPMLNGPLFTEMHVYLKILKEEHLNKWKRENHLKFIGLPSLISSGRFTYEGNELRYLIIPKYVVSLEDLREKAQRFSLKETSAIARGVLRAYEYLHDQNYSHGDVKGANLMMEKARDFEHVVLIDFGLARKLPEALVEKEDKKTAHNGTALFTSCDAHRGCLPSYRGDLEILIHNMLYWLAGSLPWEGFVDDLPRVFEAKKKLISDAEKELPLLLNDKKACSTLSNLYKAQRAMSFSEKINVAELLKTL